MPNSTVPVTEAKAKFLELVARVSERDDEIVITKKGKPAAVLVSIEEFQSLKESFEILKDPDLMQKLRLAHAYAQNGGQGASFEKVFGEPLDPGQERSKKP